MKIITVGGKYYSKVDDDDYESLSKYNWCASNKNGYVYAVATIKGKKITMSDFLMNKRKGFIIYHRDYDTLNNQRYNLRECTRQQNQFNQRVLTVKTSKYKGVSFDKARQKWRASIFLNYKQIAIGRFSDEIEAAMAYDNTAKKLHGEYAYLNFKGEDQNLSEVI